MIRRSPVFMALLLGSAPAGALEFSKLPDDTAPRTPTAAIILGFTPEDIDQPGTPLDAVGSIGTAASDAGGIPDSFAIELMPYWLGTKASRGLDLRKYVNGGAQSILQNIGVSVALDQQTSLAGDPDTDDLRAAVGLHTTIWGAPAASTAQGRFAASWDKLFGTAIPMPAPAPATTPAPAPAPDDPEAKKEDACATSLQDLSGFAAWLNSKLAADVAANQSKNLARVDEEQAAAAALCNSVNAAQLPKTGKACIDAGFLPQGTAALPTDDPTTLGKLKVILGQLDEANGKVEKDMSAATLKLLKDAAKDPKALGGELANYLDSVGFQDAYNECGDLLKRREGFVVELAGGVGVLSPDQTLSETGLSDWSAWAAPGWVADKWSVTGLARLRGGELYDTPTLHLDVGAGVGYAWPVVTLGLQGLYGIPLGDSTASGKVVITDDIRITSGVYFSSAFGGTWPVDEPGSFLSFLSIKFRSDKTATLETPGPAEMSTLLGDE